MSVAPDRRLVIVKVWLPQSQASFQQRHCAPMSLDQAGMECSHRGIFLNHRTREAPSGWPGLGNYTQFCSCGIFKRQSHLPAVTAMFHSLKTKDWWSWLWQCAYSDLLMTRRQLDVLVTLLVVKSDVLRLTHDLHLISHLLAITKKGQSMLAFMFWAKRNSIMSVFLVLHIDNRIWRASDRCAGPSCFNTVPSALQGFLSQSLTWRSRVLLTSSLVPRFVWPSNICADDRVQSWSTTRTDLSDAVLSLRCEMWSTRRFKSDLSVTHWCRRDFYLAQTLHSPLQSGECRQQARVKGLHPKKSITERNRALHVCRVSREIVLLLVMKKTFALTCFKSSTSCSFLAKHSSTAAKARSPAGVFKLFVHIVCLLIQTRGHVFNLVDGMAEKRQGLVAKGFHFCSDHLLSLLDHIVNTNDCLLIGMSPKRCILHTLRRRTVQKYLNGSLCSLHSRVVGRLFRSVTVPWSDGVGPAAGHVTSQVIIAQRSLQDSHHQTCSDPRDSLSLRLPCLVSLAQGTCPHVRRFAQRGDVLWKPVFGTARQFAFAPAKRTRNSHSVFGIRTSRQGQSINTPPTKLVQARQDARVVEFAKTYGAHCSHRDTSSRPTNIRTKQKRSLKRKKNFSCPLWVGDSTSSNIHGIPTMAWVHVSSLLTITASWCAGAVSLNFNCQAYVIMSEQFLLDRSRFTWIDTVGGMWLRKYHFFWIFDRFCVLDNYSKHGSASSAILCESWARWEIEIEREIDRERERERERERQTDRQTETERERERERERDIRQWRHHCHPEIGDELTLSLAKIRTFRFSLHFSLDEWSRDQNKWSNPAQSLVVLPIEKWTKLVPITIGNTYVEKEIVCEVTRRDKPYLRKSTDRKAQISPLSWTKAFLIHFVLCDL